MLIIIMQDYQSHYKESLENSEGFWMEQAREIDWFTAPEKGNFQDDSGLYRWFKGAKLNTSYLCIDYHVNNGRADQTALILG